MRRYPICVISFRIFIKNKKDKKINERSGKINKDLNRSRTRSGEIEVSDNHPLPTAETVVNTGKANQTTVIIHEPDEDMILQVEAGNNDFLSEGKGEDGEPLTHVVPQSKNNNARLEEVKEPLSLDEEERKSMMKFARFLEENGFLRQSSNSSTGRSNLESQPGTSGEPSQL